MNKDKIECAIESQINEHENEIIRLKEFLKIYNYSLGGEVITEETTSKRKYVKSGKYANRKRKYKYERKKLSGSMKRIGWRKLITKVLESKGRPMTSKQLIESLFKGKHKSTLKVLKRRLSVVLALYKKDGTLKTNKNGRGLKYGLPKIF